MSARRRVETATKVCVWTLADFDAVSTANVCARPFRLSSTTVQSCVGPAVFLLLRFNFYSPLRPPDHIHRLLFCPVMHAMMFNKYDANKYTTSAISTLFDISVHSPAVFVITLPGLFLLQRMFSTLLIRIIHSVIHFTYLFLDTSND